jgi:hypothetical protein
LTAAKSQSKICSPCMPPIQGPGGLSVSDQKHSFCHNFPRLDFYEKLALLGVDFPCGKTNTRMPQKYIEHDPINKKRL